MVHRFTVLLSAVFCLSFLGGCNLETPPECFPGRQKCEFDSYVARGVGSACGADHKWHPYACLGLCNEEETDCESIENIPACQGDGEQKCEDTQSASISFTCINQKWMPSLCESGSFCDGNQCASTGKCVDGTRFCMYVVELGASVSIVCTGNRWMTEYCPLGVGCDGDSCAAVPLGDVTQCGEPAVDCTTSMAGWRDGVCRYGNCEAIECTDGYHLYRNACEENDNDHCGTHETSCASAENVEHSISTSCSREKGVCEATSCSDGYHVFDGKCEKDDNDHCGTHEGKCTTEQYAGSTSVSCDTGVCIITNCSSEYIKTDNVCLEKECHEGNEKCVNEDNVGRMYKCISSEWVKQDPCTGNVSCTSDNSMCGVCQNSDTKCENDSDKIGSVSTCMGGEWSETSSCSTTSCAGKGCGECKNNDQKCSNDPNTQIGVKYRCNAGIWGNGTSCNNKSCTNNAYTHDCGSCLNGIVCKMEASTLDDTYQSCNNGRYLGDYKSCTTTVPNALGACTDSTRCESFKCKMAHVTSIDTSGGTCKATACEPGYSVCNDTCVDKQNDNNNCGICERVCDIDAKAVCIAGECDTSHTCGDNINDYLTKTVIDPVTFESKSVQAYCINSPAAFSRVRDAINRGETYPSQNTDNAYILVNDLTLDPETYVPIGSEKYRFKGYFLGNNKSIFLNDGEVPVTFSGFGLFGEVTNSYIDSLNLYINLGVYGRTGVIGGIAGNIRGSVVKNVSVHPTIKLSTIYPVQGIGGAFGAVSGKIENLVVSEAFINQVSGSDLMYIGGVAGMAYSGTTFESCGFDGRITALRNAAIGGLVGNNYGTIYNSFSNGTLETSSSSVGGLVGGQSGGTIATSYSSMAVTGKTVEYTGGAVGALSGGTIIDCSATGTSTGSSFIGTISSGTVTNCYSLGKVSNATQGGFISVVNSSVSVENSYYNNASGVDIGSGSNNASTLQLEPVVISESSGVYTVYAPNGATLLGNSLGSNWTNKTCTIDIGDGTKTYVIPISTTIYPDFCH